MDRNYYHSRGLNRAEVVALRKESVDRNPYLTNYHFTGIFVALRKESVDRNMILSLKKIFKEQSLSARRAWIEISCTPHSRRSRKVALRKESVDRNFWPFCRFPPFCMSLSARRAWIEIKRRTYQPNAKRASLSARRAWIEMLVSAFTSFCLASRSPQGERG